MYYLKDETNVTMLLNKSISIKTTKILKSLESVFIQNSMFVNNQPNLSKKELYKKASAIINKNRLQKSIVGLQIEKSVVNEKDIKKFIEILIRQIGNGSEDFKSTLRSIENCCEGEDDREIIENTVVKDSIKMTLIKVKRLDNKFHISICSFNREIKLATISNYWREWIGKDDEKVFSKLLDLFDNNEFEIFKFLALNAING